MHLFTFFGIIVCTHPGVQQGFKGIVYPHMKIIYIYIYTHTVYVYTHTTNLLN